MGRRHCQGGRTRQGPPRPPYPRARGVPPLDSGLRTTWREIQTLSARNLKKRSFFKTIEMSHGPTENKKRHGREQVLSVAVLFVFPDALHPLGGKCRPARGYRRSPRVSLASKWIRTHQKYPVRLSWGGYGRGILWPQRIPLPQYFYIFGSRDNVPGSGYGAE